MIATLAGTSSISFRVTPFSSKPSGPSRVGRTSAACLVSPKPDTVRLGADSCRDSPQGRSRIRRPSGKNRGDLKGHQWAGCVSKVWPSTPTAACAPFASPGILAIPRTLSDEKRRITPRARGVRGAISTVTMTIVAVRVISLAFEVEGDKWLAPSCFPGQTTRKSIRLSIIEAPGGGRPG